jgi:apolipoprotein N-acyltransferase
VGALAFPDTDWWLLGWLWLLPVLGSAVASPPRRALAQGWLAGTVFFLVLLRWLDHTFRSYSAIPWPLTWLPILALAAYCGLYVGAVGSAVAALGRGLGPGRALAASPALWVGAEWIRGRLFEGFPWGLLGYSQHAVLPVIQVAELTGVWGVSFLIVAGTAALAGLACLGWRRAWPGLLAATLLVVLALAFGWWRLRDLEREARAAPRAQVAVIQPSVAQTLKWEPAHQAEMLAVYEAQTRQAARALGAGPGPAVILWPETAAPIFLRDDPELLARLRGLAAELRVPLLVGSIDRQEGSDPALLNTAFFLTGQGIRAKYDKIHLVPFGEYVPLSGVLGFVRDWAAFISEMAPGRRYTVMPLDGAPFGTVICYEVIFPELFREFVSRGARFMANITNDAWFGQTSGPWQHLGMLPFRAVEHRVAIARSANTGISAFVEPSGRVARTLGLTERGVLVAEVPLRTRTTLYTRWGDWFPAACLALSAAGLGWTLRRRRDRDAG